MSTQNSSERTGDAIDVDIEYLSASNWSESIWPRLDWLRENQPVYWSEKDQIWIVTRFEDVSYVSKNQQIFTSALGVRPGNPAKIGLIDEGEPRHAQLRAMINKGFSPRMVTRLEKIFRDITTEALDVIADKGECDFVESVAVPLPLLLIAEMIGIRKEDRADFHRWSDTMIAADGNMDNPEIMAKAGQSFVEYSTYVTKIIEDRRQNPKDDLVSILTGAKDDGLLRNFEQDQKAGAEDLIPGQQMDLANDELLMLLTILMVAGNETTRNAISGGMQLLIENPEVRQRLIDDPSLIPAATEEMIRLVSPVRTFSRTVVEDTEIGGVELKKGQIVLMVYRTANRDPREYDAPDVFDIDRNAQHVGFGLGSHFCLGANLARMEIRVAFEELLTRLPDMEYSDGGPVLKPGSLVRSCVEMKVRYTPAS
jgi:cytochrome P450 family 142 subfamily A polypeptide 1